MTRNCNDSLNDILENLVSKILVEKPCKIIKIHSQSLVDVEYFDNGTYDILCCVPVKHLQTQNGFVFLGLNVGDFGTVRFFDNNVAQYYEGKTDSASQDGRKHDINNGLFVLGFFPKTEQYLFPEGDVVIGCVGGGLINMTRDNISITGGNIIISGGKVSISGNTVVDGKNFLEHTHSNGNNGAPTGGVL